MKWTLIVSVLVTVILAIVLARDPIRWCRSEARRCSRDEFTALITPRLEEMEKSAMAAANASIPGPDGAPAAGGLDPKCAGSYTADPPCQCPAGQVPDPADATKCKPAARRRRKRQAPPTTPAPDAAGAAGAAAGGAAVPNVTTTTTSTEKPSMPLFPNKVYKEEELEETFYKCLDKLGVSQCRVFMTQRCNWHDGTSKVIPKYCSKWGIPCKPCQGKK